MISPMLRVTALDFDYQDKPLLQDVNCYLPQGGLLHIQGANGVGKTTLLKLIAGLYRPLSGAVHFEGQLCYVGHQPGIHRYLTLRENCLYDTHYRANEHNIDELAAVFGLQSMVDMPLALLSAGQQKQVGLLRLWMTEAKLWLLDEPLVALDEASQGLLMAHMQQHRQRGGGIILTSHQAMPLDIQDYQVYTL
jgi:heme exporter protein A